jgi:hypothetical protein
MNVGFADINAADAAKMIGVDYSTLTGWCRRRLINFVDVSENSSTKARYLIPEKEVDHLIDLKKKYGNRKILLYYKKDWEEMPMNGDETLDEPVETTSEEKPAKKKFDIDEITTTIAYMQDIKERLEDIEAEKNQLLAEYEQLKKEVMDAI